MLISNYSERQLRASTKKRIILEFLRDETWTSPQVVARLINLSIGSAYKILNRLKNEQLIISHHVKDLNLVIWGITTHGLMESWNDSDFETEDRPYFQPSRVKPVMMRHHIMLQQARLQAEVKHWSNWKPGNLLAKGIAKRPDAIAVSSIGQNIAIELERTIKTKKRYEAIISLYLQAIKRKKYDEVHYVVPDKKFATSLKRLFGLITHVPVSGERIAISKTKHLSKFLVYEIGKWPL
jgi:hypothetical protein